MTDAGCSKWQHSRQMMATPPCDGKGNHAPRITPDPTRRAQQTVFKASTNVCYSGRLQVPSSTGSGQPAAGQEELPPRPTPICQARSIPTCQRCSEDARKHLAAGGSTSLAHASLRRCGKKTPVTKENSLPKGNNLNQNSLLESEKLQCIKSYFSVATKYKPAT